MILEKFSVLNLINYFAISGDSMQSKFPTKVIGGPKQPGEGRGLRPCSMSLPKLPLSFDVAPYKKLYIEDVQLRLFVV